MENKKRRIYSRRGDLGETSLCFGPRVGKDHKRIAACGDLDELNSWLGLVRTEPLAPGMADLLRGIQQKIFDVSAEVASFTPEKFRIAMVSAEDITRLEEYIDAWDKRLTPLNHFLVPGGCRSAALLQLARAVCRRAERRVVALVRSDETVSRLLIGWLNRLADLLFTLARAENLFHGTEES
ncbi:MAG: cob(I)yrinic acid a,c-diamide adenosyltransferase [Planctomycetia bacterium]|nr:cob(I)yrinic acid a,c-diamide adenosyltransferase [Planctomycetia bacterium]